MRYLLFTFLLLPFAGKAQSDWQTVQMDPSVLLFDLHFQDDGLHGWAVGGGKTGGSYLSAIYHTTNGGLNWDLVNFPFSNGAVLNGVFFISPDQGWVVGDEGKIYLTKNAGQTWTIQTSNTNRKLAAVFFLNDTLGWIAGGWQDGASNLVLQTTDGGLTWENIGFGSNAFNLSSVFFLDELTGWVGGRKNNLDPVIYQTLDGGQTWTEQLLPVSGGNMDIPSIEFANDRKGWAASSSIYIPGPIFYTEDGGQTWVIQENTNLHYHELDVRDSLHVAVVGVRILSPAEEEVWVTNDGGQSWESHTPPVLHYTYGIQYKGDQIWLASEYSALLRSPDNGESWDWQHYAPLLKSLAWSTDDKGYVVAGYPLGNPNYAISSADGGDSWVVDPSVPGGSDIQFQGESTGWVLFENNNASFFRTTNGGASWTQHPLGTSNWTEGFFFVNPTQGWAFGSNGNLRTTANGGAAWSPQQANTTFFVGSVFFADPLTGWAGGGYGFGNGFIHHTTDGGLNWIPQTPASDQQVVELFFLDNQTGWAVTTDGYVQQTLNGGQNWELISQVDHPFIEGIFMLDPLTGWLLARNSTGLFPPEDGRGYIYRTEDGGNSWLLDWVGPWPNSGMEDFALKPDSTELWVCGDHNTLLKLVLMEETAAGEKTAPAPRLQAFPNPFTDDLTLQVNGDEAFFLEIFTPDAHPVFSRFGQGAQQISLAGEELAPGPYFIQLRTGGWVETILVVKN